MNESINKKDLEQIKAWLGTGTLNIFGRPFSGKDTQGKRLAEIFNAPLIGGGDIIRSSKDKDLKASIAKGKLAPQDDFLKLVLPYLSRDEFKNKPLILSTFGRWHGEEEPILNAAKNAGHPVRTVIALNIPEETVKARWQVAKKTGDRGVRSDDDEQHIQTRLNEYRNKTIPALQYYKDNNLLVEVDGTKSTDEVTTCILHKLQEIAVTK